jgi:hypothetical protein
MATYSRFLGGAVKVQYRQGDIFLSASGTFVADSGRSIFLEQHLEQRGKRSYFRWEIPYPYIHRIEALSHSENAEGHTNSSTSRARGAAACANAGGTSAIADPLEPLPPLNEP